MRLGSAARLAAALAPCPKALVRWGSVTTKDIRTSTQDTVCDVCGRTLLRGERADAYLDGSARRSVCELCKERALHEGWVREGTVTGYEDSYSQPDRRRSLLSRLRGRREQNEGPVNAPSLRDELDGHAWSEASARTEEPPAAASSSPVPATSSGRGAGSSGHRPSAASPSRDRNGREAAAAREPRHVRAVPTSTEQKIASAVQLFNGSEHPRTVAGVARSLGSPDAAVLPSLTSTSLVSLTISWELCWYRYEVDLSDEVPSVRVVGQGYELADLPAQELQGNAVADERGALHLG